MSRHRAARPSRRSLLSSLVVLALAISITTVVASVAPRAAIAATPNTITVTGAFTGRANAADQITVGVGAGATSTAAQTSSPSKGVTTSPLTTVAGTTYQINEGWTNASLPDSDLYLKPTFACTDVTTGSTVAATATANPMVWTLTITNNDAYSCTFTVTPTPFQCGDEQFNAYLAGPFVYVAQRSGASYLVQSNTNTGGSGFQDRTSSAYSGLLDALGLRDDGAVAYAMDPAGHIISYTVATDTFATIATTGKTNMQMGAVDPVNNLYYFAAAVAGAPLNAYNIVTNTFIGQVGKLPSPILNGDITFDRVGHGYLMTNGVLSQFSPVPATVGTTTLALTTLSSGYNTTVTGIGWGLDGYIATSDVVPPGGRTYDPLVGGSVAVYPTAGLYIAPGEVDTDAAQCDAPRLIQLNKVITGRFAATDQFQVSMTLTVPPLNEGFHSYTESATTTGTGTTASTQQFAVVDNTTASITETATSGSVFNYTSTINCTDTITGHVYANSPGYSAFFTISAQGAATNKFGGNIVCTITNTKQPLLTISKVSVGATGAFSFTGTNGYPGETITTTTSGVAKSGSLQTLTTPGLQTTITETGPPAGYTVSANCTGLPAGSFSLAANVLTLTSAATVAGANIACTFTNTTVASLSSSKLLTKVNGVAATAGQVVHAGDTLTYTLTITNTGQVGYPALTVTDDVSGVLDDAKLQMPLTTGLTESESTLTYTGALPVTDNASDPLVVTYAVVVDNPDLGDGKLANVVTGGTSGGDCPGTDDCATNNPVKTPAIVTLAFTGEDSLLQLILAALTIGLGVLLLLATTRRRPVRNR